MYTTASKSQSSSDSGGSKRAFALESGIATGSIAKLSLIRVCGQFCARLLLTCCVAHLNAFCDCSLAALVGTGKGGRVLGRLAVVKLPVRGREWRRPSVTSCLYMCAALANSEGEGGCQVSVTGIFS